MLAPFGGGAIVFDPVKETAYFVGPLATLILTAVDSTSFDVFVEDVAGVIDEDLDVVTESVWRTVLELRHSGLIDRQEDPPPNQGIFGSLLPANQRPHGLVHPIIDHRIAFRSSDKDLLLEIDTYLGSGLDVGEPSLFIDIERGDGEEFVLIASSEWKFPTKTAFFAQIFDVLNEYAARSTTAPVLHASAVRAPSGQIVVIPGRINAGKSTLAAALIRRGFDYISDESVGIRFDMMSVIGYPKLLALDHNSREVIGLTNTNSVHVDPKEIREDVELLYGDVGRVDMVLFAQFDPLEELVISDLSPYHSLQRLMKHTLNLGYAGERGLRTLCQLAESTRTAEVLYRDVNQFAEVLVTDLLN